LPFRLGRQTVPRPLQVIGSHLHTRSVLPFLVWLVTPLLLRYPLLLTQPVAILRRIVPRHHVHRAIARRCSPPINRMILAEAEKLFPRDFLGGDGERAADTLPMPQLHRPVGTSFTA